MISILLCDGCQVSVNFSLGQHPATNRIVYYLLTVTTRPTPYKLVSLSRPFLVANAICNQYSQTSAKTLVTRVSH